MATTTDQIRTVTIRGKTEGIDEAAKSLNTLSDAQSGVAKSGDVMAVTTDTSAKKTLSAENAYERLRKQLDSNYASQDKLAKGGAVLQRALDQGLISTNEHAKMQALLEQRYNSGTTSVGAFSKALLPIQMQLIALSSGAGMVGTMLAAFGPWGLAAAIGIGAISTALNMATERANAFSEGAKKIKESAETAGLSINQFKALSITGAKVGMDAEKTSIFIDRLTISYDQLRHGSGALFDQLARINPALVSEVAAAKDTATAIDVLARAYATMTDQAQKNALSRAIGGRGGVQGGLMLESVANQGGLNSIVAGAAAAGKSIDEDLVKRVTQLRIEIDQTRKSADNMINAIFSEAVLQKELMAAQAFKSIAQSAKDLADAQSKMSWWERFFDNIGRAEMAAAGIDTSMADATRRLASKMPQPNGRAIAGDGIGPVWTPPSYRDEQAVPAAAKAAASPVPLAAQLALMERWAGAMGNALTPSQQLTKEILKVNTAISENKITAQEGARVIQLFGMAQVQASIATKESFGVATQNEIVRSKMISLNKAVADGQIKNAGDIKLAENIIQREARNTYEALQVRASALPGLKQMELDAGRLDKQLDTFATGSLNNLTTGLVDIATGTKSAGDAFKSFGLVVLRSLEEMIIKMTVVMPIAKALQATLGGSGFSFSSLFGGGTYGGGGIGDQGPTLAMLKHSGGIIGDGIGPGRYVHPTYFDDAPRYHTGGVVGDELPIIAKRGEGVFTPAQMAAMGGSKGPTVVMNNDFRGAAPEAVAAIAMQLRQLQKSMSQMPQIVAATAITRPTMMRG